MPHFYPSHASGVQNPNSGRQLDASTIPWFAAPSTSHIWGWKFFDGRIYANLGDVCPPLGDVSLLLVRFKLKTGNPGPGYFYGFTDAALGQSISDDMENSPHPYGLVLWPKVIQPQVIPYTKA